MRERKRTAHVPMSCEAKLVSEWQGTGMRRVNSELRKEPRGRNRGPTQTLVRFEPW